MMTYIHLTAFPSILLRMRNVCDKSCIKNQNTVLCLVTFSENHTTYELMWGEGGRHSQAGHR